MVSAADKAQEKADKAMDASLARQAEMNAKSLEYNTAMAALQMAMGLTNKISGR